MVSYFSFAWTSIRIWMEEIKPGSPGKNVIWMLAKQYAWLFRFLNCQNSESRKTIHNYSTPEPFGTIYKLWIRVLIEDVKPVLLENLEKEYGEESKSWMFFGLFRPSHLVAKLKQWFFNRIFYRKFDVFRDFFDEKQVFSYGEYWVWTRTWLNFIMLIEKSEMVNNLTQGR